MPATTPLPDDAAQRLDRTFAGRDYDPPDGSMPVEEAIARHPGPVSLALRDLADGVERGVLVHRWTGDALRICRARPPRMGTA